MAMIIILAIGGNKRKFPDFIVIGMQKCGTTALQYFLNYHPQLKSPSEGELHFFEREGNYQKGYEYYLNQMPFAAEGIDYTIVEKDFTTCQAWCHLT